MMRLEEAELLASMDGVESVVDVERDALWNSMERLAIEIDHGAAHTQQSARVRQILEARDRRMRGELALGRRETLRHLEHRITAQSRGVVAVLIAGADHEQAKANDVGERVGDEIGIARITDAAGEPLRDVHALLDLTQQQHAAIG